MLGTEAQAQLSRDLANLVSLFEGETKEIKVAVYIDKSTAGSMNSGNDKVEDILVIHLEGGKDLFVSFRAAICLFVCLFVCLFP